MKWEKKSKKFSKSDISNAIATMTSFALEHFLWIRYTKKKNKKIKNDSNSELTVNQLIVNYQIESCELYEIKFSILKTTNNKVVKSCFFESFKKMYFQIFNADWLEIENEKYSSAKITMTMIFQFTISSAKIAITAIFQVFRIKHIYTNSKISMSKNMNHFKKLRC